MAAMAETLEDSNLANIGSDADKAARKAAAMTGDEWQGAGERPGLQIWRVENRRSKSGAPDFGVKPWPVENFGEFYSGDSYVLLKTTADPETGALSWDVHFWIGESSSQDEYGVAAYKAVELDDLLDGLPVQHREMMGHESRSFLSYFTGNIKYLEGGIASGFRHVAPEDYEPRLLHIARVGRLTRAMQVPCTRESLNHGDAFVLDAGREVYVWFGDDCSPFERAKAGTVAHDIIGTRNGKARKCEVNPSFWEMLGGEGNIAETAPERPPDAPQTDLKLYRLSDSTGTMKMTMVDPSLDSLQADDVFIADGGNEIFVWVGSGASRDERAQAIAFADTYIKQVGKPRHTPVTRLTEGQHTGSAAFMELFK